MQAANTPAAIHPVLSDLNAHRLIRLKEVLSLFPVSQATWYAGVKAGRFPAPVRLGGTVGCSVAWRASDIAQLLQTGYISNTLH